MWPESDESARPLKTGLTTGCCATACCVASAHKLLGKVHTTHASVTLPKGKVVQLHIVGYQLLSSNSLRADVIKDAGDDPDATHGATVFVELTLIDHPGIIFAAAEGVGTVTREGLSLAVGEPAINSVPRQMMTEHLQKIATEYNYLGGFNIAVGVENGEQIALKTMNGRLGILGGLSILGVSGIVRPFSCAAYIASIYQGIDVATVNGYRHIIASTGNRSEDAMRDYYQMPDIALIEMGDFVGAVLTQIKKVGNVDRLTFCAGFGKMSKLAMGKWNLHSQASTIDFEFLASLAKDKGASSELIEKILAANTSIEVMQLCLAQKIDLASSICESAYNEVRKKIPKQTRIELWTIDRQGALIGYAGESTQ